VRKSNGSQPRRRRYRIVNQATLLNRLEIPDWDSFARWYKSTLDDMLCRTEQIGRQSFWSSAIAVGDAEWLGKAARWSDMKRFEIRETDDMARDGAVNVRSFFLGSIHQAKII